MTLVGHLINGQMVASDDRTQDVYNPATGEVSKQVALASQTTVALAIYAAQAAFPEWRDTPAIKRCKAPYPASPCSISSGTSGCIHRDATLIYGATQSSGSDLHLELVLRTPLRQRFSHQNRFVMN